jgi:hypothetical protein
MENIKYSIKLYKIFFERKNKNVLKKRNTKVKNGEYKSL